MVLLNNAIFFQDSLPVNNANVIGAGDTVISSFVASDTSKNELSFTLKFSSLCAGLSVLHFCKQTVKKIYFLKNLIYNKKIKIKKNKIKKNINLIRESYKKLN